MTELNALFEQRRKLEEEIIAAKILAAESIRQQMAALGLTIADLMPPRTGGYVASKRAVKYRDDAGHTWTGVGQRPRWLRAAVLAGADLESFRVK